MPQSVPHSLVVTDTIRTINSAFQAHWPETLRAVVSTRRNAMKLSVTCNEIAQCHTTEGSQGCYAQLAWHACEDTIVLCLCRLTHSRALQDCCGAVHLHGENTKPLRLPVFTGHHFHTTPIFIFSSQTFRQGYFFREITLIQACHATPLGKP